MSTTLVRSCGRCGAPDQRSTSCARCGVAQVPARTDPAQPLRGVLLGTATSVTGAVALDLLVVVVPAVLAWLPLASDLVTRRSGAALDVALGLGLVLLVAVLGAIVLRGRALGGLALGLRLVDRKTGQPVRAGRLARRILGGSRPGLVWAAVRVRRDPATSGLADDAGPLAASGPAPAVSYPRAYTARPSAIGLRLSDGRLTQVDHALLVGRDPDRTLAPAGRSCAVLTWPDLSRRLARTHLLLERDGWTLWATDLGGSTTVVGPNGDRTVLEAHQRTPLETGAVLRCSARTLTVLATTA